MSQSAQTPATPQPGDTVMLKGVLTFSRLASWVDGEELAQYNSSNPGMERNSPYVTVGLKNPQIVPSDAAGPNAVEQFTLSKIKPARSGKNAGVPVFYGNRNKPRTGEGVLPSVFKRNSDGTVSQIDMVADLAPDQEVLLLMSYFTFRRGQNEEGSLSIESLIVNSENPAFFGSVDVAKDLQRFGITISGDVTPRVGADVQPEGENVPAQPEQTDFNQSQAYGEPQQNQPVQQSQAPMFQAHPQQNQVNPNPWEAAGQAMAPQQSQQPAQQAQPQQSQQASAFDPWNVGGNQ